MPATDINGGVTVEADEIVIGGKSKERAYGLAGE